MKNNRERKPERKRINIRLDDPVFDELHDLKRLGKFKDWEALKTRYFYSGFFRFNETIIVYLSTLL